MSRARRLLALAAAVVAGALAVASTDARAADPRVVAFTPFTANIVAELGVRPIAIGRPPAGEQFFSSKLDGVPRIPLSHPNGANLEQLVALRPNIVLSSPTWRAGTPNIQRLGIKVYDGVDPQRIATVRLGILQIADIVGKPAAGRALAARMDAQIAAARRGIPKRRPKVLVVLGLSRYTVALLGKTWGGDVVTQAGGTLATAGLKPLAESGPATAAANVSNEEVVRLNPDIIIVVPHGATSDIQTIARYYRNYAPWRTTNAARNGRIYVPTDDQLLQATADPARTIREVRQKYLHNWPTGRR